MADSSSLASFLNHSDIRIVRPVLKLTRELAESWLPSPGDPKPKRSTAPGRRRQSTRSSDRLRNECAKCAAIHRCPWKRFRQNSKSGSGSLFRFHGKEFEGIGLLKFLGGIAGEDRAAGESSVLKGSS